MQISPEGKLGLALGLVALAGTGALVVAHGTLATEIGWALILIAAIGGILLAAYHFGKFPFGPLTRKAAATEPSSKGIKIIVGTGEPYEAIDVVGVNRRCHVRVRLENNTAEEISNCRLDLLNMDPPSEGRSEFALKLDVTVGAHSHKFIDVAYRDIGSSQAQPSGFIRLAVPPLPGGYVGGSYYAFARLSLREHTFHLRFSRFSEVHDHIFCALSLDQTGLVRLENRIAPANNRTIRVNAIDAFLRVIENSRWAAERRANATLLPPSDRSELYLSDEERLESQLRRALRQEIRQRLRDGDLTAWGASDRGKPVRPIEKEDWDHSYIRFEEDTFKSRSACAWSELNVTNRIRYVDVQLSQQEMLAAYPTA